MNSTARHTRKAAPQTPRQALVANLMNGECCGPMSTGYDVVMHSCSHTDYETVEMNAYYQDCPGCGNIDTQCGKCIDEQVADNLQYWTDEARRAA